MDGVQIGVLVVMCVIFVATAAFLITLIIRFGCFGLCKPKQTQNINSNIIPEQQFILHFIDMSNTPRSLDIHALSITDGVSLQSAISTLCGLADPSTISLNYINEVGCNVEVDLDLLVKRDDELGKRLEQTERQPLLLSRHVRSIEIHNNNNNLVSTNMSVVDQQQENKKGMYGNVNHYDPIEVNYTRGTSHKSSKHIFMNNNNNNNNNKSGHSNISPFNIPSTQIKGKINSPPPPIILPLYSHISSTTPIIIIAVEYYYYYINNNNNNNTQSNREIKIDAQSSAMIEEVMISGKKGVLSLEDGSRVVVIPEQQSAWLIDDNNINNNIIINNNNNNNYNKIPLLRRAADVLQYTVDNMSTAQWSLYKNPIYLPPGRWCIRAESSSSDHRFVETISRVFTVDIVGRK